jgi:hypothetical protein
VSSEMVGGYLWKGAKFVGRASWIIATSVVVVVLPLMWAVEGEQMLIDEARKYPYY